ncbi:MAG TPA: hypothetical protein VG077_18955 [Verrucomicrobiae bacterium]|nr:hypothetical protein [Verrucomicrobiae bacterium]
MKRTGILLREKLSFSRCLPLALVAMTLVVTGCPHNQYFLELKPNGKVMERTLVFYCEDGVNTNTGMPNYQSFDAGELATITALYPPHGLTNDGLRYVGRGEFTNELPADVGGAGSYLYLTNNLGEAGFYVERFRGNDNLAGMTERRFQAADQLADLLVGWSRMELGREPGYDKLRQFLGVDFRRDLKNLGAYVWEGELTGSYSTNASEEFMVRFGQYLVEHGYLTMEDVPAIFREVYGDDPPALWHRIQRLVAHKMGVPDTEPVPVSLAFLANETTMEKSFDKYLAGTDLYRAKLKQWAEDKKQKPDLKQPEPSEVLNEPIGNLLEFDLFGQPDHLTVQLSLPGPPLHSNGRWDKAHKHVIWESDIEGRTNATHFPFFCYASWAQADGRFQKKHFGRMILTGDRLTRYCLWRGSQDSRDGDAWDAFLAGLKPGRGLAERIGAFRFSGEPAQTGTNAQEKVASPSAYARELLQAALK